ncbi:hypothetical protein V2J09_018701 [Rumex salicifolius]
MISFPLEFHLSTLHLSPNSSNYLQIPLPSSLDCRKWREFGRDSNTKRSRITMRDRSNNRKPLQKGRNLSIEAIQTVQTLKRAKRDADSLEKAFDSKLRRLLKFDMVAVLRELIRQGECQLALKVFEDIRAEHWYKPRVLLYNTLISALASAEMLEEVEHIFSTLKNESNLQPDQEGFNTLLSTLVNFNLTGLAMECLNLMTALECDPDKPAFKMLINYLESQSERELAYIVRQEALKIFWSLNFLEEEEIVEA